MAYNFNKGTANQITVTASTLSIPSTFIAPGSIAATTTVTAGTNLVATAGNLLLPLTSSTVGQLQINAARFLHSYGTSNTFIGNVAGNFTLNTGTAIDNVGVGTSVLASLTSGSANTAVGFQSSNAITSGVNNVSVGYNSLLTNATGINNTAIGYECMKVATNDNNVGLGNDTLFLLTSGARNTGVGTASLSALLTGTDNIGIGYQAGQSYVGAESGNIIIGLAHGTAAESNITRIGYNSSNASVQTKFFADGVYNSAVGATAGVVLSDSVGQVGSLSGTTSQVLLGGTKPSWGQVTLTTQVTGVLPIANGGTNTSATPGTNALMYFDGTSYVGLANGITGQVLNASTGAVPVWTTLSSESVTAIAGTTNQITASASTGSVTLSTPSTFIAPGTIASTTTNAAGTFFLLPTTSSTAGQIKINSVPVFHTFGTNNTFVGASAGNFTLGGGGGMVCIGTNAGAVLTGSTNAVYIGYNSGASDALSGNSNTAVGAGSLSLFTGVSQARNTCMGEGVLTSLLTGKRNVALGYSAGINYVGAESDNIIIGSDNSGTASESNVLRIGNGTGTADGNLNKAFIAGIQGITVTGTAVLVSASDQLGIAVSSRRYKTNITNMDDYSSDILKLRPVNFTYIVGNDYSQQSGLIAEEVAEVMPQLVVNDKLDMPQTVKYHDLPVLLLNELQKALKRIAFLEEQIFEKDR